MDITTVVGPALALALPVGSRLRASSLTPSRALTSIVTVVGGSSTGLPRSPLIAGRVAARPIVPSPEQK